MFQSPIGFVLDSFQFVYIWPLPERASLLIYCPCILRAVLRVHKAPHLQCLLFLTAALCPLLSGLCRTDRTGPRTSQESSPGCGPGGKVPSHNVAMSEWEFPRVICSGQSAVFKRRKEKKCDSFDIVQNADVIIYFIYERKCVCIRLNCRICAYTFKLKSQSNFYKCISV